MGGLATCLAISLLYVVPMNLFGGSRSRDDPHTIKRRMLCVLGSCLLAWLPVLILAKASPQKAWQALGLTWGKLPNTLLLPLLQVGVLFLGPMLMLLLDWCDAVMHTPLGSRMHLRPVSCLLRCAQQVITTQRVRDYAIAPVAEEWAFRACMLPLLLCGGWSPLASAALAPACFGLAHLHHLRELTVHQGLTLATALPLVAIQFTFTTVFGWHASSVMLATGSICPAVLVHVFCNVMGFPAFGDLARHPQSWLLKPALVLGVVGFVGSYGRLQEPSLYGNVMMGSKGGNAYIDLCTGLQS